MTLTVHFETQPDYCSVSRLQTWWTCKTTSMSLLNNLKLSLSSFSEKRLKLNVQISLNLSDCRVGLIRTMIPFVHISKDHNETQKYKHCCTQRMSSKLQTLSSEIAKPSKMLEVETAALETTHAQLCGILHYYAYIFIHSSPSITILPYKLYYFWKHVHILCCNKCIVYI